MGIADCASLCGPLGTNVLAQRREVAARRLDRLGTESWPESSSCCVHCCIKPCLPAAARPTCWSAPVNYSGFLHCSFRPSLAPLSDRHPVLPMTAMQRPSAQFRSLLSRDPLLTGSLRLAALSVEGSHLWDCGAPSF